MGERRARRDSLEVHLAYAFDRLFEWKLAQAYDMLVPGRGRLTGARVKEKSEHEDGRNLCPGVLRAAARGTHHCEPNGGPGRVREEPRSGGARGVGVRRRRL